jgi:hypothetical protein
MYREFVGPQLAACGSPPCRAYRPYRRCGRVAEGGGLLNRYRVVKPYRGFESLRLRQFCKANIICKAGLNAGRDSTRHQDASDAEYPAHLPVTGTTYREGHLVRNVNMIGRKPLLMALDHRHVGAFDMPCI